MVSVIPSIDGFGKISSRGQFAYVLYIPVFHQYLVSKNRFIHSSDLILQTGYCLDPYFRLHTSWYSTRCSNTRFTDGQKLDSQKDVSVIVRSMRSAYALMVNYWFDFVAYSVGHKVQLCRCM